MRAGPRRHPACSRPMRAGPRRRPTCSRPMQGRPTCRETAPRRGGADTGSTWRCCFPGARTLRAFWASAPCISPTSCRIAAGAGGKQLKCTESEACRPGISFISPICCRRAVHFPRFPPRRPGGGRETGDVHRTLRRFGGVPCFRANEAAATAVRGCLFCLFPQSGALYAKPALSFP